MSLLARYTYEEVSGTGKTLNLSMLMSAGAVADPKATLSIGPGSSFPPTKYNVGLAGCWNCTSVLTGGMRVSNDAIRVYFYVGGVICFYPYKIPCMWSVQVTDLVRLQKLVASLRKYASVAKVYVQGGKLGWQVYESKVLVKTMFIHCNVVPPSTSTSSKDPTRSVGDNKLDPPRRIAPSCEETAPPFFADLRFWEDQLRDWFGVSTAAQLLLTPNMIARAAKKVKRTDAGICIEQTPGMPPPDPNMLQIELGKDAPSAYEIRATHDPFLQKRDDGLELDRMKRYLKMDVKAAVSAIKVLAKRTVRVDTANGRSFYKYVSVTTLPPESAYIYKVRIQGSGVSTLASIFRQLQIAFHTFQPQVTLESSTLSPVSDKAKGPSKTDQAKLVPPKVDQAKLVDKATLTLRSPGPLLTEFRFSVTLASPSDNTNPFVLYRSSVATQTAPPTAIGHVISKPFYFAAHLSDVSFMDWYFMRTAPCHVLATYSGRSDAPDLRSIFHVFICQKLSWLADFM